MDPATAAPALGYAPLLLTVVLAAGVGAVTLVLGVLVRPSKPNPVKALAYECGNLPIGDARLPMRTRFYIFAMLLVIFGFIEMMIFLGVLLLGYGYLWRNGGLQWD